MTGWHLSCKYFERDCHENLQTQLVLFFSPLPFVSVFQLCFGVGSSEIRRQSEKKQRNVVLAVVAADQVMYSVWRLKLRSLNQTSWLSWVFSVTPSSCISLVSCCGSGPIKLTASQSGQQCNKWADSSWGWVVGRLKKWQYFVIAQ